MKKDERYQKDSQNIDRKEIDSAMAKKEKAKQTNNITQDAT